VWNGSGSRGKGGRYGSRNDPAQQPRHDELQLPQDDPTLARLADLQERIRLAEARAARVREEAAPVCCSDWFGANHPVAVSNLTLVSEPPSPSVMTGSFHLVV
jgi:hypothetical protein